MLCLLLSRETYGGLTLIQCCGVSRTFAEGMGLSEAVTPPFPNSDHWYVQHSNKSVAPGTKV